MLGPAIARQRKLKDHTQRSLAARLGVTKATVHFYERCLVGKRTYVPDDKMLSELVRVLFEEHEREVALAQWQYLAMVDRAQIEYPGFLDRIRKARLRLDV